MNKFTGIVAVFHLKLLILGPVSTVPKEGKDFHGRVTEIVNGEVIVVKVGNVYRRITLSSIRLL